MRLPRYDEWLTSAEPGNQYEGYLCCEHCPPEGYDVSLMGPWQCPRNNAHLYPCEDCS